MDIWRIENFQPIPLPKYEYGKFYTGDSYIVLQVCIKYIIISCLIYSINYLFLFSDNQLSCALSGIFA